MAKYHIFTFKTLIVGYVNNLIGICKVLPTGDNVCYNRS